MKRVITKFFILNFITIATIVPVKAFFSESAQSEQMERQADLQEQRNRQTQLSATKKISNQLLQSARAIEISQLKRQIADLKARSKSPSAMYNICQLENKLAQLENRPQDVKRCVYPIK